MKGCNAVARGDTRGTSELLHSDHRAMVGRIVVREQDQLQGEGVGEAPGVEPGAMVPLGPCAPAVGQQDAGGHLDPSDRLDKRAALLRGRRAQGEGPDDAVEARGGPAIREKHVSLA